MPFERQYDEADVLDRAMRAFWARGYEATSVSHLVQATGINRGSLYAAFAGKRGLFLEALKHYDRKYRERFLARIAEANAPRDAIIAAFEEAARPNADDATPGGCLLVNTALELSPHDPEVRRLVNTSLEAVERFFRAMIEKAVADGSLAARIRPEDTAKALLGLFVGLRVLMRSRADRSVVDAVIEQARTALT